MSTARRLYDKYVPTPEEIHGNRYFKPLAPLLGRNHLWHINRKSVAKAFMFGVFFALLPFPGQTFGGILAAIFLGANLPITLGVVWSTNPITIPIVFSMTLMLGFAMTGTPEGMEAFHFNVSWLMQNWDQWLADNWDYAMIPLFVGSLTAGAVLSLFAYIGVDVLWRRRIYKKWRARQEARALSSSSG